jgi:hypothetical protein
MNELEELKQSHSRLCGRLTANEFAIKLLIATHPDKDLLKALWNQWLHENIDIWMNHQGYSSNDALRAGIHDQLAALAGFLDFPFPPVKNEREED